MYKIAKLFFLAACLLVAAFLANHFGYVSIPWLKFNVVSTYGNQVKEVDEAAKKVFTD